MTGEMVERVARAICLADGGGIMGCSCKAPTDCTRWAEREDSARAAIATIREPSEAMLKAGEHSAWNYYDHDSIWRDMIDAALAE